MIAAIPSPTDRYSDWLRRLFPGVAYSGINHRRCCCVEVQRECCAPASGQLPSAVSLVVSGNLPCTFAALPTPSGTGYIAQNDLNGAFSINRQPGTNCVFIEGDLSLPLLNGPVIGGLKHLPNGITLIDSTTGTPVPNWPAVVQPNAKVYRRVSLNFNGPNSSGVSFAFVAWTYYTNGFSFNPNAVSVVGSVFSSRAPSPFSCPGGVAQNVWVPTDPPVSPDFIGCAHHLSPNNFETQVVAHSGTATFALA